MINFQKEKKGYRSRVTVTNWGHVILLVKCCNHFKQFSKQFLKQFLKALKCLHSSKICNLRRYNTFYLMNETNIVTL